MRRIPLLFLCLLLAGCMTAVSDPLPLPTAPPEPLELSVHFKGDSVEPFVIREWMVSPGTAQTVSTEAVTRYIYSDVRVRRGDEEKRFSADVTFQHISPKYFQVIIFDLTESPATPQP